MSINNKRKHHKYSPLSLIKQINTMMDSSNLTRLFIIMIMIFILMAVMKPIPFLTLGNFSSMAFQMPEFGLLAIAIMIAMITGGIDLSVVGIANVSGIVAALILVRLIPENASSSQVVLIILLAILASLVIGLICGLINGVAVSIIGIPAILTTLGTMQLFMGIAIIITEGKAVLGLPSQFAFLGNGELGPVPVPMILFIIVAVSFSVILNKTTYGTKLYMMGTNPKASKFSGINNIRITIKTYMLSGLLASMAGLIIIARTNSAKADYGVSYTLQAVLVAVMGGVNPSGGFGKIIGIVMAMLTLQFLSSGINAMHLSNFFKDFIWGAALILVMVTNYVGEQMKQKKIANGN